PLPSYRYYGTTSSASASASSRRSGPNYYRYPGSASVYRPSARSASSGRVFFRPYSGSATTSLRRRRASRV
ncbi:hypothetical protein TI39_contig3897g00001, partial [Zymoseptoria brevis]